MSDRRRPRDARSGESGQGLARRSVNRHHDGSADDEYPLLEVFVHEDESDDPATLAEVFKNRSRDHARNAYLMLYEPEQLTARAGQGVRQGFAHAGPLEL